MNNTATSYPAKIHTPIEIQIPELGPVLDHGLTLVHSIGGTPRNYLHEFSVERSEALVIQYAELSGYTQKLGWVKNEQKYWTYCKQFPLTVAEW